LTLQKLAQVLGEETRMLRPRLLVARVLLAPLPAYAGSRLRVAVLRALGFSIGHGTVMWGLPLFGGAPDPHRLLTVGRYCHFNVGCVLDLNASITIGDEVALGHQVMLLTANHEIGGRERRASHLTSRPVNIGDGCWLASRCTVLPGVKVGAGSVVAAGAVVTQDVPPNSLVAGVPARVTRTLAG
jgi:maltose O-acetyltransferase